MRQLHQKNVADVDAAHRQCRRPQNVKDALVLESLDLVPEIPAPKTRGHEAAARRHRLPPLRLVLEGPAVVPENLEVVPRRSRGRAASTSRQL